MPLLGIAGFGFLISTIAIKDSAPTEFFKALCKYAPLLGADVVCLGLAAGTALAHRFYSTHCLSYQIEILRLMKRSENPDWTESEREANRELLKKRQTSQGRILIISRGLVLISALLLLLGTMVVAFTFAATLFGTQQEVGPEAAKQVS